MLHWSSFLFCTILVRLGEKMWEQFRIICAPFPKTPTLNKQKICTELHSMFEQSESANRKRNIVEWVVSFPGQIFFIWGVFDGKNKFEGFFFVSECELNLILSFLGNFDYMVLCFISFFCAIFVRLCDECVNGFGFHFWFHCLLHFLCDFLCIFCWQFLKFCV